jgi:hypothetical protein
MNERMEKQDSSNETVKAKEEQKTELRNDLDILKQKVLKFLRVYFPQSFFEVKIKNGNSVSKDGGSVSYIVEIKTTLVKTTERTKRAILYLEEKFREEGLTEEEFEKLLYLKRLLRKDNMIKQEITRILLHNKILGEEKVANFIIEGFEVGSLIDSSVDEVYC